MLGWRNIFKMRDGCEFGRNRGQTIIGGIVAPSKDMSESLIPEIRNHDLAWKSCLFSVDAIRFLR